MILPALADQAELIRRSSGHSHSGFNWIDYYMFQWAWHKFHWWATLIYFGYVVVIGALQGIWEAVTGR